MCDKKVFLMGVMVVFFGFFVLIHLILIHDIHLPQPSQSRHTVDKLRQLWSRVSQQNVFQVVDPNITTTYVYSAYYDDRPAPDVISWRNASKHPVRVFAWFRRYENSPFDSNRRWRCVFWNDEFEMIEDVRVEGFTDTNSFDTNSKLARGMLLCPFATFDNCTDASNKPSISCPRRSTPWAVSIVISPWKSPLNLIKVVDLSTRRNQISSLIDERNNSSKSHVPFAVCVQPLFGNFITVYDIVEFIEVNMVFGAQLFFFFVSTNDIKVRRVLEHYEQLSVVETASWVLPPDLDREAPYNGHLLAQTECQHRLMYRTKYLVIMDVDEFIVPARTEDWSSMLALIHKESKYGNGDRIASYNFRNRFFPLERPAIDLPELDGFADLKYSMNWTKTLTKITGHVKLFPWEVRSKTIAPPERVLLWHTHLILDDHVVPPGEYNLHVDEKDAVMHHYRRVVGLLEDQQHTMNYTRMWHFSQKIIPRLQTSLARLQSLHLV